MDDIFNQPNYDITGGGVILCGILHPLLTAEGNDRTEQISFQVDRQLVGALFTDLCASVLACAQTCSAFRVTL